MWNWGGRSGSHSAGAPGDTSALLARAFFSRIAWQPPGVAPQGLDDGTETCSWAHWGSAMMLVWPSSALHGVVFVRLFCGRRWGFVLALAIGCGLSLQPVEAAVSRGQQGTHGACPGLHMASQRSGLGADPLLHTRDSGLVASGRAAFESGQVVRLPAQVRPLPTPCRGARAGFPSVEVQTEPHVGRDSLVPAVDPAVPLRPWDGHLVSLLEQARVEGGDGCFFLAATLLDSLFAHFEGVPSVWDSDAAVGSVVHAAPAPPTVLSLASAVPAPAAGVETFRLDVGQCATPCDQRLCSDLMQRVSSAALCQVPLGVPRQERFRAWVEQGAPGRALQSWETLVLTSDGSFCPGTGQAGWAVVCSAVDQTGVLPGQFLGCIYGPWHVGALQLAPCAAEPNAYLAETLGLLWTAIIAFKLHPDGHLVVRADNQAALLGVAGSCDMPVHPVCVGARCFHLALQLLGTAAVSHQHVYGHAGDCANELADGLAGLAAASREALGSFAIDLAPWLADAALAARWLPHVCLTSFRPSSMPSLQHGIFSWDLQVPGARLSAELAIAPFLRPLQPPPSVDAESRLAVCNWTVATFNVLSLISADIEVPTASPEAGSGLYGATGRIALLEAALHERQVFLAGIQESRTPAGSVHGARYVRYCSGCNSRRCYGTELWVARGPGWPSHTATVLLADYCRLVARLDVGARSFLVFVGHAPHRAHTEQVRCDWWAETKAVCARFSTGAPWLLLLDGNCRIGSVVSECVGDLHADEEDLSGHALHQLLRSLRCWIPSTFPAHMSGPGGTLIQRPSGALQRSDYVCLPLAWRQHDIAARVDPQVSAGHANADHFAVVVQCRLLFGHSQVARRARVDAAALADPANRDQVLGILGRVPAIPWDVSAGDHAALLSEFLFTELSQAFPLRARRMRSSFLSEETTHLHQQIARLRHALRNRVEALRLTLIRCAFQAWRTPGVDLLVLFGGSWLRRLRGVIALFARHLSAAGKELRRMCRRDKRHHLERLADAVETAPAAEIQVALKRLLRPRKFRRGGPAPLPHLKDADGKVCQSFAQIQDAWRQHFSELEGGVQTSPAELAAACASRQAALPAREALCCASIPDLDGLRSVFRGVSPWKAVGPDGIPPALCRPFATPLTALFWPIVLKVLCFRAEPLGYKGGTLHHIPKAGAADRACCASERGILVQSALEKVLHKVLRPAAVRKLDGTAQPLQIGGRAGKSHVMGFCCTRLFLDVMKARSQSAGILFCDLAAAYYAIVREALVGCDPYSTPLAEVASSLGLTAEDLQALQHYASTDPVLGGEEADEVLLSLTRELHTDTWFIINQDHAVVKTRRGTRPGSSWADVLFSLLFTRVIDRRGNFDELGYRPRIGSGGRSSLTPVGRVALRSLCRTSSMRMTLLRVLWPMRRVACLRRSLTLLAALLMPC